MVGLLCALRKERKNPDSSTATAAELQIYVSRLMRKSKNTLENFLGLLRYSRFIGNRVAEVRLLELLDGSEVLEKISDIVKKIAGEKKQKEVFRGIKLPPLGTSSKDKPKVTRKLMERLETELGEPSCRAVLLSGPHAEAKEYFLQERKDFLASKNIDDFLEKRHKEYVAELEKHMKEKTLYFTQEIDENVLEYVRHTPTCQNGVREGDIIYVTKIPYMAKKYLKENDPKIKRYHYCHCPWVRDTLRDRDFTQLLLLQRRLRETTLGSHLRPAREGRCRGECAQREPHLQVCDPHTPEVRFSSKLNGLYAID